MAVLVEGISVVVQRRCIESKYKGGWLSFAASAPNATMCNDEQLVRIGFLSPEEVEEYVKALERHGLTFLLDGKSQDVAIVDQLRGPTTSVDWLEFARLPWGESGGKVSACWFFNGPRVGSGVHIPGGKFAISTPRGWRYQESLSAKYTFVPKA